MTLFEQYCDEFADRCVAAYLGQKDQSLGPEMVPQINGDPSNIEARIEQLIMQQLPQVLATAHIDGHRRMNVKLSPRIT